MKLGLIDYQLQAYHFRNDGAQPRRASRQIMRVEYSLEAIACAPNGRRHGQMTAHREDITSARTRRAITRRR